MSGIPDGKRIRELMISIGHEHSMSIYLAFKQIVMETRIALGDSAWPAVSGWLYENPDTGTECSDQHPIESGECPDAEKVRTASAEALRGELFAAWEALEWTRQRLAERGEELATERERCADIVEQHLGDGEGVRFALYAIRNPVGALAKAISQSIDDGTFAVQSATTSIPTPKDRPDERD